MSNQVNTVIAALSEKIERLEDVVQQMAIKHSHQHALINDLKAQLEAKEEYDEVAIELRDDTDEDGQDGEETQG